MATARAFPIVRYDPDVTGDAGTLLAPPYDVFDDTERDRLAADAPHQSALLERPVGGRGDAAAALLAEWRESGALQEGEIGIVVVRQRFEGPDGVRRSRTGVLCEVEVSAPDAGRVLHHERTFSAPRDARMKLMQATGANISPVFLAYHDAERSLDDLVAAVTDADPDISATTGDGTQVAAWVVTDLATCELFERAVDPHALLIADGHHRYTAALAYQTAHAAADAPALRLAGGTDTALPPHTGTSGANGVLAFVVNSADAGMVVFPTHRIVRGATAKDVETFAFDSGAMAFDAQPTVGDALAALDELTVPGVVMVDGEQATLLSVPELSDLELALPEAAEITRNQDVSALHALLLDGGAQLVDNGATVEYTRSLDEALTAAHDPNTIVFLQRPMSVADVHAVAAAGDVLPQKSTYFYPKVPTGLAFRLL